MMAKPGDKTGTCGCGRSPTGNCCGWHALTEEQYLDQLNAYLFEAAEEDKENGTNQST